MPYDCENERIRYPNRVLVNLYARLGLHRYNLSEVNNLKKKLVSVSFQYFDQFLSFLIKIIDVFLMSGNKFRVSPLEEIQHEYDFDLLVPHHFGRL